MFSLSTSLNPIFHLWGTVLPEVWTELQFCLGLKSDGGTILVAVLGSTFPAHRLGIWNLEFILLSMEVNLSLLVISLLSALDCKLVTALSTLRTKSWTAIIITSVCHPATQNQHRGKIFDCEVAGSIR